MSKINDRTGYGAELDQLRNDVNLDSLHGINYPASTTSITIDIDRQGDTIEFTSSSDVTATLDQISTILGDAHTTDFKICLTVSGSGVVTINCSGSDTFSNGNTSLKLFKGQTIELQTDSTGTIWNIIGRNSSGRVLLDVKTASASSSIEFTDYITDEFDIYEIKIVNAILSASTQFLLSVSQDGGLSWENDAGEYLSEFSTLTFMFVSQTNGHLSPGINGAIRVYNPSETTKTVFNIRTSINTGATQHTTYDEEYRHDTQVAVNGFRFETATGNIASGTFKLYGIK